VTTRCRVTVEEDAASPSSVTVPDGREIRSSVDTSHRAFPVPAPVSQITSAMSHW